MREIDRLRQEVKRLEGTLQKIVCLDVTTREGQRAFAEWRNQHDRQSRS
jgi:hypothetical protein